jgi:adenosyl cobinamide kinase/adenosyl cobinamide phosphate guanylyltransferase
LLTTMSETGMNWVVVSNEVGMAGVPEHPVARAYRDALGRANQVVMRAADEAYLLVAGAPLKVK